MKFSDFLFESARLRKINKDTFIEDVQTECSDIIALLKTSQRALLRGEAGARSTDGPFVASIRKNRKPVEMEDVRHHMFNAALQRNGLTAHRGNSIFCTTDAETASTWGAVCLILPKNGFKYTWFEDFSKANEGYYVFDEINFKMSGIERSVDYFKQVIIDAGKKNVKLAKEIVATRNFGGGGPAGRTFKRQFQEYGLVETGDSLNDPSDFFDYLMDEFVNDLGATSKGINRFLNVNSEILITGVDYYGIPLGMNGAQKWREHPIVKKILQE